MLEVWIDNTFVIFAGRVFQQSEYLWVQTVLLFSPTCFFIRVRQISFRGFSWTTKRNYKNVVRSFNFVDRIYPIELEIKDTTDTDMSASYLDRHLEIDSEVRLRTKRYDKRDDFNFPIVIFPFICSNIPAAPAYGVYISALIRYSRACGSCNDFIDRWLLLTRNLKPTVPLS